MPLRTTINSGDRMIIASVLTLAMTPCTLIYRFVHTLGSSGNAPEMLGSAKPKSEGFSAQAHMEQQHDVPTQPNGADV